MRLVVGLALSSVFFAQTSALRIVVIEGEDAVNIVQQKTAVRPLIEVRDRNNVPVAGATVTFTIGGGQPAAFAGGVQTLTVTTNAAGQAAASGFNVLGPGAVQLQVQAAYQGQIATAAISQTNFATAAAASQASAASSGAGGSSSGAAGGAAGGGGGISGTTIGIVGAAVAGGAVAATKTGVLGGEDADATDIYRGSFSGQAIFRSSGPNGTTCTTTRSMTGTMQIDMKIDNSGGRAYIEGTQVDQSVIGLCGLNSTPNGFTTPDTFATGGPSALAFTSTRTFANQTTKVTFNGSHSGNTITGTITVENHIQDAAFTGDGTGTVTITLTRVAGR